MHPMRNDYYVSGLSTGTKLVNMPATSVRNLKNQVRGATIDWNHPVS